MHANDISNLYFNVVGIINIVPEQKLRPYVYLV